MNLYKITNKINNFENIIKNKESKINKNIENLELRYAKLLSLSGGETTQGVKKIIHGSFENDNNICEIKKEITTLKTELKNLKYDFFKNEIIVKANIWNFFAKKLNFLVNLFALFGCGLVGILAGFVISSCATIFIILGITLILEEQIFCTFLIIVSIGLYTFCFNLGLSIFNYDYKKDYFTRHKPLKEKNDL